MYFAPTEVVYNHKVLKEQLKEQLKVHKALTCLKFFKLLRLLCALRGKTQNSLRSLCILRALRGKI